MKKACVCVHVCVYACLLHLWKRLSEAIPETPVNVSKRVSLGNKLSSNFCTRNMALPFHIPCSHLQVHYPGTRG